MSRDARFRFSQTYNLFRNICRMSHRHVIVYRVAAIFHHKFYFLVKCKSACGAMAGDGDDELDENIEWVV